jgi:hypothetical protein
MEVQLSKKGPDAELPLDDGAARLPRLLFVGFTTALLFIWIATHT